MIDLPEGGQALRLRKLGGMRTPDVVVTAFRLVEANVRVRHLASLAGRVSTDAKARAARANGLEGGRPPKRAGNRNAKSG